MPKHLKDKRAVAMHEARHFLLFWHFGISVAEVAIWKDGEYYSGIVKEQTQRLETDKTAIAARAARKIMIFAAGPLFATATGLDMRLSKKKINDIILEVFFSGGKGANTDIANIFWLLNVWTEKRRWKVIEELMIKTARILRSHRRQLKMIAKRIFQRQRLNGREAERLFKALGPAEASTIPEDLIF